MGHRFTRWRPVGNGSTVGRFHGGLTTKIHALVDVLGHSVRLVLTHGQADKAPVNAHLLADLQEGAALNADRYSTVASSTRPN